MSLIGGLAAAGASVMSSIFGSNMSYSTARKLMDKQDAINMRNWNLENEYNSPLNQRSRLLDAGINPIFAMDSANNTANAISPTGLPAVSSTDFSTAVPNALAGYMADSQRRNVEADTEQKAALTATENAIRDKRVDLLGVQIPNTIVDTLKKGEETKNAAVNTEKARAEMSFMGQTMQQHWAQLSIEQFRAGVDAYRAQTERDLADNTIDVTQKEIALSFLSTYADVFLKRAQVNETEARVNNINASTDNILEDTILKGQQAEVNEWNNDIIRSNRDAYSTSVTESWRANSLDNDRREHDVDTLRSQQGLKRRYTTHGNSYSDFVFSSTDYVKSLLGSSFGVMLPMR